VHLLVAGTKREQVEKPPGQEFGEAVHLMSTTKIVAQPEPGPTTLVGVSRWLEERSVFEVVIGLYLAAFFVRLLLAVLAGMNTPFVQDAKEYFDGAASLIQRHNYSRLWEDGVARLSAKRVPGTSLFIAVGILLFGPHPSSARLIEIVVSSFSAPLVYLFALRVAPAVPAILAGLCCALYPTWIFISGVAVTSEAFLVPLLLLSFLLTLKAIDLRASGTAFAAGLTWGVATLVRPIASPMVGTVALYLAWRAGWKRGLLLGVGFVLILAPWLIRNYFVFGRPLLSTQGGEVFLGANNSYVIDVPVSHGAWVQPADLPQYGDKLEGIVDEVRLNNLEYDLGLDFLRENPRVIPRLIFYKLVRWLTPVTETPGLARVLVLASYGPLLLFLFVGLFQGIYKRSVTLDLVLIWTAVLTVMTIVYWGILTRGRFFLELVWIPWACLSLWNLLHAIPQAKTKKALSLLA
jgi:4-amino-4-deoxy-L-arabinose transferase-like glycosyltransferase